MNRSSDVSLSRLARELNESCCLRWSVNADAIAIVFLRVVKRRVHRGEHLRQRQHVSRRTSLGQTNAQRRLSLEMCNRIREIHRGKSLAELLHDLLRLMDRRLRQSDHEFIPAIAKREIGFAKRDAHTIRERAQHVV